MTEKVSVMNPKSCGACVIIIGTLIAVSVLAYTSEHNIDAQMMGNLGSKSNMSSTLHELQQKAMANGTINLEQTIFKAIDSKINVSLTQAITNAERSVGNNSFAVAAFGGEYGGYFVYQIIIGTPEMQFYTILVDPGNGHILGTQKVSAAELDAMHKEHSVEVVRGNHSGGVTGFPFLIPH